MKFRALLLLYCCLAGAAFADIKLTREQLGQNVQACLAENKLSQAFYKSSDESLKYLTDEQKSCYIACMFRKAGVIKDDGRVQPLKDEVDAAEEIKDCTTQARGDVCKLADCLLKSGKFFIPIV